MHPRQNLNADCILYDDSGSTQVTTHWTLQFDNTVEFVDIHEALFSEPFSSLIISGAPRRDTLETYNNSLTIIEVPLYFDKSSLNCGTMTFPEIFKYTIRIFGEYTHPLHTCEGL